MSSERNSWLWDQAWGGYDTPPVRLAVGGSVRPCQVFGSLLTAVRFEPDFEAILETSAPILLLVGLDQQPRFL